MKRYFLIIAVLLCLFSGCSAPTQSEQITATTLPVYEFTVVLCEDTEIQVNRLFDQNLSCLHDYTLQVSQMRLLESSDLVILSGAGLEEAFEDIIPAQAGIVDASEGISLLEGEECDHEGHAHHHEADPHIWLSPENAVLMARNICKNLSAQYPQHADTFAVNLQSLELRLKELSEYARTQLSTLKCRELITFHDGFAYMAQAFDLEILHALEEESGSEASAAMLIELIGLVSQHELPAIFTETNGSPSAASIISAETGVAVYELDMAMSGDSYFDSMYHNIDTLKEALE